GAGTSRLGRQGRAGAGEAEGVVGAVRACTSPGSSAVGSPIVALARATTPSPVARSTKQEARKPGIEPACPTQIRSPSSTNRSPRPYDGDRIWVGHTGSMQIGRAHV